MKRRKRLEAAKRKKRERAAEVARKLRHGSDPQPSPTLIYVPEVMHGYRPGDALLVHGHGKFVVKSVSETGFTLELVDDV